MKALRIFIFFSLWLGVVSLLVAQQAKLQGEVVEAYTSRALPGVRVVLYGPNGSKVDSAYTVLNVPGQTENPREQLNAADTSGVVANYELHLPSEGHYRLTYDCEGYETVERYVQVHFKDHRKVYQVRPVMLPKLAKNLETVEVRTSKIRMMYKGDTLIYNVGSFQIDRREMLNRLIARLPGVEIRDGGIYVQGKFVDNILLNGKDFFYSNPQTVFRTLPVYLVQRIEIHDKDGSASETSGIDWQDQDYVMNVYLKRKYKGTWMAFPEAGYGPERYAFLFYGMHLGEKNAFSFSADLNNINQRRVATDFSKAVADRNRGLEKQGNLSFKYHYQPHEKLTMDVGALYHFGEVNIDARKLEETFLSGGNLFEQSLDKSSESPRSLEAGLDLSYRPREGRYFNLTYNLNYGNNRYRELNRMASFGESSLHYNLTEIMDSIFPDNWTGALRDTLIHYVREEDYRKERPVEQSVKATAHFAFQPHLLVLTGTADFSHVDKERFDHYRLSYPNNPDARFDYRNRYSYDKFRNQRYGLTAEYYIKYAKTQEVDGQVIPYVTLGFSRASALNPLFRLERLEGWGAKTLHPLGTLPSTRDSLQSAVDYANSSNSIRHDARQTLGMRWRHQFRLRDASSMTLEGDFPFELAEKRMEHERYLQYFKVRRRSFMFNPTFEVNWSPKRPEQSPTKFKLTVGTQGRQPKLNYMLNVRDDRDPLNISLGNSDLKNERSYSAEFEYRQRWGKKQATLYAIVGYEAIQHAVAMSSVYDKSTGVRTFRPENVNGNYEIDARLGYNRPLDHRQKWIFSSESRLLMDHDVDLNTLNTETDAQYIRVMNWLTSQRLSLKYRPLAYWNFQASFYGEWNLMNDSRSEVSRLNTFQLFYRFSMAARLPWKMDFNTSCRIETRYGFNDESLYGATFLWDASLGKSFCKDRLNVKIEAHDILDDNRFTYVSVNAQGRTEAWTNSLPRYFMLSVAYRFDQSPKP